MSVSLPNDPPSTRPGLLPEPSSSVVNSSLSSIDPAAASRELSSIARHPESLDLLNRDQEADAEPGCFSKCLQSVGCWIVWILTCGLWDLFPKSTLNEQQEEVPSTINPDPLATTGSSDTAQQLTDEGSTDTVRADDRLPHSQNLSVETTNPDPQTVIGPSEAAQPELTVIHPVELSGLTSLEPVEAPISLTELGLPEETPEENVAILRIINKLRWPPIAALQKVCHGNIQHLNDVLELCVGLNENPRKQFSEDMDPEIISGAYLIMMYRRPNCCVPLDMFRELAPMGKQYLNEGILDEERMQEIIYRLQPFDRYLLKQLLLFIAAAASDHDDANNIIRINASSFFGQPRQARHDSEQGAAEDRRNVISALQYLYKHRERIFSRRENFS